MRAFAWMSEAAVQGLRRYEEDGAEIWFSPETGINVRFEGERTKRARRRVPRAVMFGITNRCNLRCDFCSRDVSAESRWTVDSAATLLEELAHAGVLEVAFGGGEPFAFAGFDRLIERLHRTTPLALSVTTNGTLLSEARWARFARRFAMVRLSIYPEHDWRVAARVLQASGQRWGANVLVDDQNVDALPALLEQLAAHGAHDISLLSYVGVPQRLLTIGARQRLAHTIQHAPIPCRLSVCMGDDLPVPRLWAGATRDGDCGAGVDFVSILSDGTMSACSFHETRFRVENARDVLATFLLQRVLLMTPSSRSGCARNAAPSEPAPRPAVAVWQAFSGNNSGECVLAAKFSEEADAEAFLAALRPTWSADDDYPQAWHDLFRAEKIAVPEYREASISARGCPAELGRIGRMVVAIGGGVDDVFPELRALAFRKRAKVLPGGIHLHGHATLVIAMHARDELAPAASATGFGTLRHGEVLFLTHPLADLGALEPRVVRLVAGRPFASEAVMQEVKQEHLIAAAKLLGSPYTWRPRAVASFSEWPKPNKRTEAAILDFARYLGDERTERVGSQFWFDSYRGTNRVAVAAMSRGADVRMFDGETLKLTAQLFTPWPWPNKPGKIALDAAVLTECAERVRALELRDTTVRMEHEHSVRVEVVTASPASQLRPFAAVARELGLGFDVRVEEVSPVLITLRRLLEDLASAARR